MTLLNSGSMSIGFGLPDDSSSSMKSEIASSIDPRPTNAASSGRHLRDQDVSQYPFMIMKPYHSALPEDLACCDSVTMAVRACDRAFTVIAGSRSIRTFEIRLIRLFFSSTF